MKSDEFWVLTVGAGLALLLTLANMVLFQANQRAQAEVGERGRYIQQSVELQGLYRQIAQGLGELAVSKDDAQLRELLAGEGLTINAPTTPSAEAAEP
jgi:hypothetical protein